MTVDVWTYWEGPMPPYISVCLRSMTKACDVAGVAFHAANPDNLATYLAPETLHPNYLSLAQPALRADCIRAALLAQYGGWWWDADTIGIQSPLPLMQQYPNATALYMTWDNPPVRVLNGYLYLCPGSRVAQVWLDKINHALHDSDGTNIAWCDLGERVLTNLLPECSGAHQVERRLFLPIDIDSNVKRFFEPGDASSMIEDDTVCFGLNHSWFVYHKPATILLPPERWRESPLLIHSLLTSAG